MQINSTKVNPIFKNLKKLTSLLTVLSLFCIITELKAQDFNDLNSAIEKRDSIFFDYELLNKYVQLALENNPRIKISELRTKVTKQDVELAKYSWTKEIAAQFNLNQNNASNWGIGPKQTNPDGTPSTNSFYPVYGFSLRFTVGTFVLTPMEVKKANQLHQISIEDKGNQQNVLLSEVTQSYQNYVLRQKTMLIKLESETKLHSLYGYITKNINTKESNYFEREAQAFGAYSQALEARNLAEAELRIAKFELESLIGTKLENVK